VKDPLVADRASLGRESLFEIAAFIRSAAGLRTRRQVRWLTNKRRRTAMDIRFDGKVALVTGAGSGLGEAIALELGASGATVVVTDLHEESARATAGKIIAAGGKAEAVVGDVSDPEQVRKAVEAAKKLGGLHLMVNNAGISGPVEPTGDYPLDGWKKVIDINLNAVFYGMRYGIPAILEAGGGAIVNMASILGSVGFQGAGAYVSAKHAVVGMTKNAALEYSSKGVRVNAVGPG